MFDWVRLGNRTSVCDCTVRLSRLGHCHHNAQWIWSGPINEIRIVRCVWAIMESYSASPSLPQYSCNHCPALLTIFLARCPEARSKSTTVTFKEYVLRDVTPCNLVDSYQRLRNLVADICQTAQNHVTGKTFLKCCIASRFTLTLLP
jgi:hypothetical protein